MSTSSQMDRSLKGRIYSKLPTDQKTIRLVRLLPATMSGMSGRLGIRCELFECPLEQMKGSYKALSYTWGDSKADGQAAVYCNDVLIRIGTNLYAALRRLQQHTQHLILWVDSLCINQADDEERTHQVGIMQDIYANCNEVIVWLGIRGRDDDLGEFFEPNPGGQMEDRGGRVKFYGDARDIPKLNAYVFQLSNRQFDVSPTTRDIYGAFCVISALSQGVPVSKIWYLRHLDYSPPIIRGLNAILGKSWWTRIWVVQETVVAKRATVYYSDMSIPWDTISKAAVLYNTGRLTEKLDSASYQTYGATLANFCRVITDIETTRKDWNNIQPMALLPTLRKCRARMASDRRDKVFALVGLVRSWGLDVPLLPDYSLSPWAVYWETTIRIIRSSNSLSVLAGTLGSHGETGMYPSWITDWSFTPEVNEYNRLNNLLMYNASGGVTERVTHHGSSLLETRGHFVDRVVAVYRDTDEVAAAMVTQGNSLQATVTEWSQAFEWSDLSDYIDGGSLANAFWRTICGDMLYIADEETGTSDDDRPVGHTQSKFRRAGTASTGAEAYRNWRRVDVSDNRRTSIIAGTIQETTMANDGQKGKQEFQLAAECASGSRKFFKTRRGYIGTGPRSLKEGDGVFILLGSRVPIILRISRSTKSCRQALVRPLIIPPEEKNTRIDLKDESAVKQPKNEMRMNTTCNEDHLICYKVVGDAYVHGVMDGEMVWDDSEQTQRREPEIIYLN